MAPYHETLLAFDVLEEMERIDGLLAEYDAVTVAMRTNMAMADAERLNREYGRALERLRYDPDAVPASAWKHEDVMRAAAEIMKRFRGRKSTPPVS